MQIDAVVDPVHTYNRYNMPQIFETLRLNAIYTCSKLTLQCSQF